MDRSAPTLFKCLANATRAQLMRLILRKGELYVGELIHALDDSPPGLQNDARRLDAMGDRSQQASTC
ncbi:Arsenical resistance operon repressor [Pseudomonas sp. R4-35-07]|uniref:helix-turn-helix transcriptional regulator n=1 Tax=Pseudomonas sp. R4-35-07 TaxID=658643 RepID=UPI000F5718C2|nr:helix-turn-helix transcriptional regulator [Pseudomonas sp. R4-35-07]AZF32348.1 Arsenical resistance operon repressor [Pseudomonas sp. R4-35-07]